MYSLYRKKILALSIILLLMTAIASSQTKIYLIPANDSIISISPHLVGFNNQTASKNEPWDDANLLYSLKETSAGLLRYPGGTVSNYWDMENERLFQNVEQIDTTDSNPRKWLSTENVLGWVVPMWPARNSIQNLKRAYDAMSSTNGNSAAIVYVLNMITPGADYYSLKWKRKVDETPYSDDWWKMMNDRLSRNISMLDKVVANGMDVKYIEFGNEYYFGRSSAGDGANGGAKAEPYSAGAYNTNLTGAFPGNGESYAVVVNQWADTLLKRYPAVKLCAIGAVANGTIPSRRNSWNTNVVRQIDKDLVPAVSLHVYGGIEDGNLNSNEENLGRAFQSWLNYWTWIKEYSSLPGDREFWFTEYNNNQNKKAWGHGLMNIFMLHIWLSEGNIGLSNYHQFAQNSVNSSELYAATRALAMIAKASRGKAFAQKLKLSEELLLQGTGDSKILAVVAWKFGDSSNNEHYLVINFSSQNIDIDISNIEFAENSHYVLTQTALDRTFDPGEVSGKIKQQIKLPAFSCLTFEGGKLMSVSTREITLADDNISLLPNPSCESIKIRSKTAVLNDKIFHFKTYDLQGNELMKFHGTLNEIERHINSNISNYEPGIYLIQLKNNIYSQNLKWIKN